MQNMLFRRLRVLSEEGETYCKPEDYTCFNRFLWGGSNHFSAMEELFNTFPEDQKPHFLSYDDIQNLKLTIEGLMGYSLKEIPD